MKITILGSGTSHGVPMIGCNCEVCTSANPKNHRMRPSIAVEGPGGTILIDTTPELRLQSIKTGLNHVDAVLITHTHADHIFGMDDLRRFNDLGGHDIPVYGSPEVLEDIQRIYRYVFVQTQVGGGKPRLQLRVAENIMEICGLNISCFTVLHGKLEVQSYRFEDPTTGKSFAYVTDVSIIPETVKHFLNNLDLLILDAVRYEPHPTHFGLYQALDVIANARPAAALLTHLSHHFDHDRLCQETPPHVEPAFDGQIIDLLSVPASVPCEITNLLSSS